VIDFGASKIASHDKAINGIRGTPPYMGTLSCAFIFLLKLTVKF
jgi:hypothetical protein